MSAQFILNVRRTQFYAEGHAIDAGRTLYDIHTREDLLAAFTAFMNS